MGRALCMCALQARRLILPPDVHLAEEMYPPTSPWAESLPERRAYNLGSRRCEGEGESVY